MKNRFLAFVLPFAIVLGISSAPALAKVYSPSAFRAELKLKIGKKKGSAAASAAASLLQSALSDKKNKKNVVSYTSAVNSAIKKVVPKSQLGSATNRLVKALTVGYFKSIKFNLGDSKYTSALKKFLNALPVAQRTSTVSRQIYTSIRTAASNRGVAKNVVYSYYLKVKPGSYPTPAS